MRNAVCLFLISLLAIPVLTPGLARADRDDDGIPSWVPLTVGAAVLVGGVLYIMHTRNRTVEKTPNEAARDLIYYISTEDERDELESLMTNVEVDDFMDRFWRSKDPTPGTKENEFSDEYTERFLYATREFREHGEGWKSDRGRVHMLYGQPSDVRRYDMTGRQMGGGAEWKSVELWEYQRAAGGIRLPPLLTNPGLFQCLFHEPLSYGGQMLFLFGSRTSPGTFEQIFSTEPGEKINPVIYKITC